MNSARMRALRNRPQVHAAVTGIKARTDPVRMFVTPYREAL
jgi:hypothetical protein